MANAAVVISLDFELAWGSRDKREPGAYAATLDRTRFTIDKLLSMFDRYSISATWATVGHLFLSEVHNSNGRLHPEMPRPQSSLKTGDWYDGVPDGVWNEHPHYYAPDMIDAILKCPTPQELASHTFSHVVMDPRTCSEEVAEAEVRRCQELAAKRGISMTSLVFPRNVAGHLDVLARHGFRCYRGPYSEWYWIVPPGVDYRMGPVAKIANRLVKTIQTVGRCIDEQLAIMPPLLPVTIRDGMCEIPHSMFFTGYTGPSKYLSPSRRVAKATKGIQAAIKRHRVFSFWTHPHNIASDHESLFPAFEKICQTAAAHRDQGRLEILTMAAVMKLVEKGQRPEWLAPCN